MTNRQKRLEQARRARRGQSVADIRFHRADHAPVLLAATFVAPEFAQTFELDPVSPRRSGRVAFNKVNIAWLPARLLIGLAHRAELSFGARARRSPWTSFDSPIPATTP